MVDIAYIRFVSMPASRSRQSSVGRESESAAIGGGKLGYQSRVRPCFFEAVYSVGGRLMILRVYYPFFSTRPPASVSTVRTA